VALGRVARLLWGISRLLRRVAGLLLRGIPRLLGRISWLLRRVAGLLLRVSGLLRRISSGGSRHTRRHLGIGWGSSLRRVSHRLLRRVSRGSGHRLLVHLLNWSGSHHRGSLHILGLGLHHDGLDHGSGLLSHGNSLLLTLLLHGIGVRLEGGFKIDLTSLFGFVHKGKPFFHSVSSDKLVHFDGEGTNLKRNCESDARVKWADSKDIRFIS
jgi:hypothetical protein